MAPTASHSIQPSRRRTTCDGFGNICTRVTAPAGRITVSTDFIAQRQRPARHRRAGRRADARRGACPTTSWSSCSAAATATPIICRTGLGAVRQRSDGLGARAGDLRLRPQAADLRLPARLRHPHGLGRLSRAARRVPRLCPSRHHAVPLHEHPGALLHGLPRRHRHARASPEPMDFSAWFEAYLGGQLVHLRCAPQQAAHRPHPDGARARRHRRRPVDQLRRRRGWRASRCTSTRSSRRKLHGRCSPCAARGLDAAPRERERATPSACRPPQRPLPEMPDRPCSRRRAGDRARYRRASSTGRPPNLSSTDGCSSASSGIAAMPLAPAEVGLSYDPQAHVHQPAGASRNERLALVVLRSRRVREQLEHGRSMGIGCGQARPPPAPSTPARCRRGATPSRDSCRRHRNGCRRTTPA